MPNDQPVEMMTVESIAKMLASLETDLQAPPGSLRNLAAETDWSLIIKGHALLEGSISFMLAEHLDARLRPIFNRLELGREDVGKLEFAKALHLLQPDEINFIRKMSSLRNSLAHDVRYLNFNFSDYIATLDGNKQKSFFDSLVPATTAPEQDQSYRAFVRKEPKWAIISSITRLVLKMVSTGGMAKMIRQISRTSIDYSQLAEDVEPASERHSQ